MKSSGLRRQWVRLAEAVDTPDVLGGRSQIYESYVELKAAIEPQPPAGVSESQAAVLYLVTIPYRPDTVAKYLAGLQQHVVTANKTLKILQMVTPEERNRELILQCALVTA